MAEAKIDRASSDGPRSEVEKPTETHHKRANSDPPKRTIITPTEKRKQIEADIEYIKNAQKKLQKSLDEKAKRLFDNFETLKRSLDGQGEASAADWSKLDSLHNDIITFKIEILKIQPKDSKAHQNGQSNDPRSQETKAQQQRMPKLYNDATFENSEAFKDIKEQYNGLDIRSKNCLLCLAVFPEDVTIKKRLMIYWWIGEGFIPAGTKGEEDGNQIFKDLIAKGFIEPLAVKRGFRVNSCRMNPFIRTAVIMLAEKAGFFDFDGDGNLTEDYSHSLRACLVSNNKDLGKKKDLEKVHMLFNVNEHIVELDRGLLSKMKNANILYVGRWLSTGKHHIELGDQTILKDLQHMKYLKFLSLQGVSKITELPDSISKLRNLIILDIRACQYLEVLPNSIGLLKNLTHLDMSECFLLDRMPKGLASLTNLEVLKGFVVVDLDSVDSRHVKENSCLLKDITNLQNLQKLTIYTTVKSFPAEEDLNALLKFQNLLKLTIEWGGNTFQQSGTQDVKAAEEGKDGGESVAKETKKEENNEKSEISQEPGKSDASGEEAKEIRESMVTDKEKEESERGGGKQDQDKRVVVPADTKQDDEVKTSAAAKQDSKQNNGCVAAILKRATKKFSTSETRRTEVKGGTSYDTKQDDDVKTSGAAKQDSKWPDKKENRVGEAAMKRATTRSLASDPPPGLPPNLEKLDLKCFPASYTPDWLKPGRLQNLERLYIRGGKLRDLGQDFGWDVKQQEQWNVQILRLKYLTDMKMNWRELRQLFPKLTYLEKVKCPKLTLFPCDGYGVWINKAKPEIL